MKKILLILFLLPLFSHSQILVNGWRHGSGPPPAPNLAIQGYGKDASSGDHTSAGIFNVGSQEDFISALGSNRTIRFTNDLTMTTNVYITNYHHLTIDGTGYKIRIDTNNGDDCISLENSTTHHIVIKNIETTDSGGDGINVVDGAHDIAIVNCSSWGNRDGNIDVAGGEYVSVQYCYIGTHNASTGGAGGSLITAILVSFHHNALNVKTASGEGERAPLIHGNYANSFADVRNNIVYQYGRDNSTGSGYGVGLGYGEGEGDCTSCYARANIVNNYFYTPSTVADQDGIDLEIDGVGGAEAYSAGNVSGNGFNFNTGIYTNHAEWPVTGYEIDVETACESVAYVLQYAGPDNRSTTTQAGIDEITNLGSCAYNQKRQEIIYNVMGKTTKQKTV
jgi:hypothetical protein